MNVASHWKEWIYQLIPQSVFCVAQLMTLEVEQGKNISANSLFAEKYSFGRLKTICVEFD